MLQLDELPDGADFFDMFSLVICIAFIDSPSFIHTVICWCSKSFRGPFGSTANNGTRTLKELVNPSKAISSLFSYRYSSAFRPISRPALNCGLEEHCRWSCEYL